MVPPMTCAELAALLDGNQYDHEITKEQIRLADDNNLVVVFGYSDDNVILCGAFDDEVGAYNGTDFLITKNGVLNTPDCGEDDCPYFGIAKRSAKTIKAKWNDYDGPSWSFETDIPHAEFNIFEDGELFGIGIVFSTESLP